MLTLGIDMAAQPRSTAASLLRWRDARPLIVLDEIGLDDDRIIELVAEADVSGVDCPFGWPDAFVRRVGAFHRFESLPGFTDRTDFRLRRTDYEVRTTIGRAPLSVSTDKLGVVALRWIGVLERIGGPAAARTGRDGLVEVYPGGSLTCWGIDHRGYKRGAEAAARRTEIAEALRAGLDVDLEIPIATDHQLDAFICALAARAHAVGLGRPIPPDATEVATREGWIQLPTGRLADLSRGTRT